MFLVSEGLLGGSSADNRRCSTRRCEGCEVKVYFRCYCIALSQEISLME